MSKEEDVHGKFGTELIHIIQKEYPEWFDEEMEEIVASACNKALQAELKLLDWIFEKGELDFLPINTIEHFIKDRFNNSLESIGYKPVFRVDKKVLKDVEWFDVEILSTKEGDFFNKRSIDYSKKNESITEDDIF